MKFLSASTNHLSLGCFKGVCVSRGCSFIKPKYKNIGLVPSIFTGRRNLSLQLNENHHLLVKGKPLSLQRAITNLIDNALKYGRRATLFLETSSESITLIVEDEGTNVSEDLLEYLKQPFLRGQNIGITKGTGLGLTIVSTIAEQHGGNLSFEKSKVGIELKRFDLLRRIQREFHWKDHVGLTGTNPHIAEENVSKHLTTARKIGANRGPGFCRG